MDDRIVDATAMQLVMNPWQFDVIVTTNLFGDILSDQLAGLVGGLGMAPGANIGNDDRPLEQLRIGHAQESVLKCRARSEQGQELLGMDFARSRPKPRSSAAADDKWNNAPVHHRLKR